MLCSPIFDKKSKRYYYYCRETKESSWSKPKNAAEIRSHKPKIIKNDIGFVFIDGSHTFESAENDFYAWHKKIKEGGILAIHDIYDSEEEGGQAPRTIMLKALETNFKLLRRVKSLVALVKTK